MSADNLTGQYISDTFRKILQLSDNGSYITDGTGSVVSTIPATASWAQTASYALNAVGTITNAIYAETASYSHTASFYLETDPIFVAKSASLATTGSNIFIGNQTITGSITLSGSAAIAGLKYIDFDKTASPTHLEGRVHWTDDTKTLQVDTDVNNFMIELGHQNVLRVRNTNSFTVTKGKIVYINGESGNRPTIETASWTGDPTSAGTVGWVAQDISTNNTGYVITNGIIRDINTNAYAPGTPLYLSSSGDWTSTPPDAPLHEVRVGKVITQGVAGTIYVNIMNGYELTELHDVKTTTYSDGDLLIQSNSLWINSKTLTGSYTLSGSLTINDGVWVQSLTASIVSASRITGSLFGTSSWATRANTAIIATTASVINASSNTAFTTTYIPYFLSSSTNPRTVYFSTESLLYNPALNTITVTSSYATFALNARTASIAVVANQATYATEAGTADYASNLIPGTYNITSSWAVTASQALTASYISTLRAAGNNTEIQFNNNGVLGASSNFSWNGDYMIIQPTNGNNAGYLGYWGTFANDFGLYGIGDNPIASYSDEGYHYSNDLYRFDLNTSKHRFIYDIDITGSVNISNGVLISNVTGSLFGTASWAITASHATTASYLSTLQSELNSITVFNMFIQ